MMYEIMAEVAPSLEKASGEGSWITTGFVTAVLLGIAGIVTAAAAAFKAGRAHTVDIKNQPVKVETSATPAPATWQEVRDLKERVRHIEERVEDLKSAQGKQFQMIMESNHNMELRVIDKIDAMTKPIHERIDSLLGLMNKRKKVRGTTPKI